MRKLLVLAALLVSVGCSKSDDTKLTHDMRGVGHDLKAAANSIKTDPAVKGVGAETRRTAEDAGVALQHSATDAKAMAEGAADEAKSDAQRAGHDTRDAADGARRNAGDN